MSWTAKKKNVSWLIGTWFRHCLYVSHTHTQWSERVRDYSSVCVIESQGAGVRPWLVNISVNSKNCLLPTTTIHCTHTFLYFLTFHLKTKQNMIFQFHSSFYLLTHRPMTMMIKIFFWKSFKVVESFIHISIALVQK